SEELEKGELLKSIEFTFDKGKKLSVILHPEYPRSKKTTDRFDIVLVDDSSMKSNTDWNDKRISVAIELKYGWGLNEGLFADIEKLNHVISSSKVFYGIVISLSTKNISEETLKQVSDKIEISNSDKIKTYIIAPSKIIKIPHHQIPAIAEEQLEHFPSGVMQ
ncbi:MAG: hypothetical protein ACREOB_10120, partial [Thermodesulfobacteriota bacterium]